MESQSSFDATKVIAQNVKFYHSIKPKIENNSYTVIATLNDLQSSKLLALATGTQACLKKYDNDIEDCHAESLLKRAYKRYVLDKVFSVIDDGESSAVDIKRFEGSEPIDEKTGAVIVRKPGRGQVVDGKVVYVQRDHCLNKLKKWTTEHGFQGRSINEKLGINAKFAKIVIGDCEPESELDYKSKLNELALELSTSEQSIKYELTRMRHEEFTFGHDDKQPLPVATVWWASSDNGHCGGTVEYVVDGRRLGITKKQCVANKDGLKLRSSDFWLRKDLNRIHAVIS